MKLWNYYKGEDILRSSVASCRVVPIISSWYCSCWQHILNQLLKFSIKKFTYKKKKFTYIFITMNLASVSYRLSYLNMSENEDPDILKSNFLKR